MIKEQDTKQDSSDSELSFQDSDEDENSEQREERLKERFGEISVRGRLNNCIRITFTVIAVLLIPL